MATVSPGSAGGSVQPQSVAFPVELSSDGRYLVDSSGTPFLLQGDAAWSLMVQLTTDQAADYLDARQAQGFNALVVNLIEHKFADDPPRNAEGEEPFLQPGDFSTPNPAYFDHVDKILELAQERGFVVLLAPAYLGYQGGEEGWFEDMIDNGEDVLREYGRYVGARYERFDNIIWLEGGDYDPDEEWLPLVNALVDGIKDRDPESMHTASWSPETAGLDVPVDWMDLNTVYTYDPVYMASLDQHISHPDVPQILLETAYEAEHDSTPRSIRAQAYYALLTGCVGQVYGHGDIWPFTADWREALTAPGIAGIVHLNQLFSTLPWQELVPDVDNRLLKGSLELFGPEETAVAAWSADRQLAVIYVPSENTVQLDLSGFDGPVTARFYDPANGTFRDVDGSPLAPSGAVELLTPAKNAGGDSDWVIVLERSEQ